MPWPTPTRPTRVRPAPPGLRIGTVVETRRRLRGVGFLGKLLVFPGAKGSPGWSNAVHLTPAPAVTTFDRDPLDCIETGDWVVVDGERGILQVHKRSTTNGDRP